MGETREGKANQQRYIQEETVMDIRSVERALILILRMNTIRAKKRRIGERKEEKDCGEILDVEKK